MNIECDVFGTDLLRFIERTGDHGFDTLLRRGDRAQDTGGGGPRLADRDPIFRSPYGRGGSLGAGPVGGSHAAGVDLDLEAGRSDDDHVPIIQVGAGDPGPVDDGAVIEALALSVQGKGAEVDSIALHTGQAPLDEDKTDAPHNFVAIVPQKLSLCTKACFVFLVSLVVTCEALEP